MAARGALQVGTPIVVTGTGANQQVVPTDAHILGFMVATAATSVTLYDANLTGNTGVSPAIAATQPSSANQILPATTFGIGYQPFPGVTNRGLVASITSGNVVVFFVA